MYVSYDASGNPMSITQGSDTYYYVTNVQGDVIAILNSSGTAVVEYAYDAWGNIVSTTGSKATTLGKWNPLRYRGYVYDEEYGFYYLQSRYYNPEVGRFLNADALASTSQGFLGYNMFAYCQNNPVVYIDPDGLCREVGALLTWIDCGDPNCPTSSYNDPGRYISNYEAMYELSNGKILYIYDKSNPLPNISNSGKYIFAYDMRHKPNVEGNPEIQILDSYRIYCPCEQAEILMCLLSYDACNPSDIPWSRSVESMLIEWDAHNMFALFDQSARDVNFDKNEEGKGYGYFIEKAAKRGIEKYF